MPRPSPKLLFSGLAIALFFAFSIQARAASSKLESATKLVNEKQFQKALAVLDQGVDEEPTNGEMHYWRGRCLDSLGKKTDAAAEFKLAVLLAADEKIKSLSKLELARHKVAIPKGSVADLDSVKKGKSASSISAPSLAALGRLDDTRLGEELSDSDSKKFFKLSSKKLQWNLELRPDFVKSMHERTENLGKLAKADGWRMPRPNQNNEDRRLAIEASMKQGSPHHTAPLTAEEKRLLTGSDIVIILDHSGSMQTRDCPGAGGVATGRLLWCVEELDNFTNQLYSALPHGFHLILFDSKPEAHRVNTPQDLHNILSVTQAGGGTNLALALKEAFRIHSAHPQQPLLIAVVSDAEIDVSSSEQTILEGTRMFPLPNGVFITLLQIGYLAELHTADQLNYLNKLDRNGGAAYDPFEGIPFSQVRGDGFGKDLLIGLRARLGYASATPASPVPSSNSSLPASSVGSSSSKASSIGSSSTASSTVSSPSTASSRSTSPTASQAGSSLPAASRAATSSSAGSRTPAVSKSPSLNSSPGSSTISPPVRSSSQDGSAVATPANPKGQNEADLLPIMWPAGSGSK